MNFSEASEMSQKVCDGLKQMGAEKGEVAAMFLPNCVEFPCVFSGVAKAGMAVTTMNPIYTSTEIARQLTMSKASWAFTNAELLPVILEAISKLQNSKVDWKGRIIVLSNDDEDAMKKGKLCSKSQTFSKDSRTLMRTEKIGLVCKK